MSNEFLTIDQLRRALAIEEKIAALRDELRAVLGNSSVKTSAKKSAPPAGDDARRGKRSAATRAKMAAAQKARWAKSKGPTAPAAAVAPSAKTKKKRVLSPEARARIIAAQKKRWAAVKAAKKGKA